MENLTPMAMVLLIVMTQGILTQMEMVCQTIQSQLQSLILMGMVIHLDIDSDNDGVFDVVEGGDGEFDTNGDGVIDSNDTDMLMQMEMACQTIQSPPQSPMQMEMVMGRRI